MWILQDCNVISLFSAVLDVEEAAGHSKTLRPESALHGVAMMKDKDESLKLSGETAHSDVR